MEFLAEPEVWVAVGFLIVIGILLYVGVPKMVATMLDARAAGIKAELDEARRLREEAQALLAGYQKKASEAERFAADATNALGRQIERRAQQAQDKIAQAEAAAMAEIRGLAADAATAAAQKLIAARMNADKQSALIADSIKSLGTKLN